MGLISDVKNRVSTAVSNAVDTVEKKVDSVKQTAVEAYDKADTFVHEKAAAAKKTVTEQYDTASNFYDSPNKSATASTNYEVDKLRLTQPLGDRLTPEIKKSLADGVAVPRDGESDRGARGILGKDQAARAASTITKMDGGDYESMKQLLAQTGQGADGTLVAGADPTAEKALILKAVAARSDRLKDPGSSDAAFKEIADFAKAIRGTKREELIRTTTATDVQGTSNAESMKQTYENSCAPTVSQMTRAEVDPVYARDLATMGADKVDAEQKWLYDNTSDHVVQGPSNHVVVARDVATSREQLDNFLRGNFAQQNGPIPPPVAFSRDEIGALSKHANGLPMSTAEQAALPGAKTRLDSLGDANFNSAKLDALNKAPKPDGVDEGSALKINGQHDMNAHAVVKGDEKTALKAMKSRLEAGEPVPFSIEYTGQVTGHALLATDYRDGKFLIADPYSGKTAWVSEADMKSGAFADKTFQLGGAARIDNYFAP